MKKFVVLVSSLFFTINLTAIGLGTEDIYFDNGQSHIINDNTYSIDNLHLDKNTANNPGTQLEVVNGGKVNIIYSYNNSTINMSGGDVFGSLLAYDNSTISMSGGLVSFQCFSYGNSSLTITGGEIGRNYFIHDNSVITISGGVVGEGFYGYGNSIATITNGIIGDDIQVFNDSSVTLSGGSLGSTLVASDNAIIYLVGTGFEITNLDGVTTSLSYGDKLSNYATFVDQQGTYDYNSGIIKGTLADGSILNNKFMIWNADISVDTCNIIIIPEPTTVVLLGFGGLALVRKRR